jgi:hypothetical protein
MGESPNAASAPLESSRLVGSWQVQGLDFEELTLESDGTFRAHLHQRPFDSGRWELKAGNLLLAGDGMGAYRIDGLGLQATTLTGTVDGKSVQWTLIP